MVLFPSNPHECFEHAVVAFDLAERLQTPVFVLTDLDIGMNDWMCEEFTWSDDYRWDRGKVLDAPALEQIENFHRYLDTDGDGIPYRTLPGEHPKGAYFVRGSGHNKFGGYTEDAQEYQEVVDRLLVKFATAAEMVPKPAVRRTRKGAGSAIVSLGSCDNAVHEALDRLAEQGTHLDYLCIKAFPFSKEVSDFMEGYERVFVVEQNRDAQLKSLLTLETDVPRKRLVSILSYSGLPIDCRCIVEGVSAELAKGAAA